MYLQFFTFVSQRGLSQRGQFYFESKGTQKGRFCLTHSGRSQGALFPDYATLATLHAAAKSWRTRAA